MSAPVDVLAVPAWGVWRERAGRVVSAVREFMRLARAFDRNPGYESSAAHCRKVAAERMSRLRRRKKAYARLARIQAAALRAIGGAE